MIHTFTVSSRAEFHTWFYRHKNNDWSISQCRLSSFYEMAVPDLEKAVKKRNFDKRFEWQPWFMCSFTNILFHEFNFYSLVKLEAIRKLSVYRRTCGDGYLIQERKWWRLLTCCSNTRVYNPYWRGEEKRHAFKPHYISKEESVPDILNVSIIFTALKTWYPM